MSPQQGNEESFRFADERPADVLLAPWKVLIVDDDDEVHSVTKLALSDARVLGRPLLFRDAHTGRDACRIMREEPDIAVVLMDVVMENEHAGLDAVEVIRKVIGNRHVRIVLRTGQPGQAPEREVVTKFDINDYKEKTELTTRKLFTVIHTCISHYRELTALESNRTGLRKVIDASATIFEKQSLSQFAEGVLQQLAAMLYADRDAVMLQTRSVAATRTPEQGLRILAGTGAYAGAGGKLARDVVEPDVLEILDRALREKKSAYSSRGFVGYFGTHGGAENVLYLSSDAPISLVDREVVELFCRNVSIALDNLFLKEEMERNQREMVVTLSEAIESRSLETGNHVRRVAEYSKLLARLIGLPELEAQMLFLASPLHDAGKIAIADGILNKPGPHSTAEAGLMRTHAEAGRKIFEDRDVPVLKAAAIVAGQHHERWDGEGYPGRLKGEEIHVFGRITALADVFDALCSRRCYKEPWTIERVISHLRAERGGHFDPKLVDVFMDNLDRFLEIRGRFVDVEMAPAVAQPAAAGVH
jgi:response regulator RpfG family c-di-GMP phosphodiesterase